jgi:hypothetical protein
MVANCRSCNRAKTPPRRLPRFHLRERKRSDCVATLGIFWHSSKYAELINFLVAPLQPPSFNRDRYAFDAPPLPPNFRPPAKTKYIVIGASMGGAIAIFVLLALLGAVASPKGQARLVVGDWIRFRYRLLQKTCIDLSVSRMLIIHPELKVWFSTDECFECHLARA